MTALYAKFARRYLLGKKGRSLMTLLGIALGVTMVSAVMLTNSAILASYESLLSAAAGRADLQVSAASGSGFPEQVLADVQTVREVGAAVPAVTSGAPVVAGERKSGATFYGVDPALDTQVRSYKLKDGRLPRRTDGRETAISSDLAQALGIGVGQTYSILTTTGLQEFTVVGIFDAGGTVRGALGPFGILPLRTAQEIFGKVGKLDLIDVIVAKGSDIAAARERLTEALGSRVRVGTPVERSRDMQKVLDSVKFVLTMAGSISLFAGAFIIYTNVAMGVAERRRDLSILRALGLRRREVLSLVLSEAGILGLFGSVLGLFWGYGLAGAMARQLTGQVLVAYGLQKAQVTLDGVTTALALIVGVGTALFAAAGPARETVRVSPVEAMRPDGQGDTARERHVVLRAAAGLLLLAGGVAFTYLTWPEQGMLSALMLRAWGVAMALMLLGVVILLPVLLPLVDRWLLRPLLARVLGVTGRLAADNLVRNPRRTAATVCALMVSLAWMVAMGGVKASQVASFDNWYNKAVGWDLNISTSYAGLGAQVEIDPALARDLAAVPGVRLVSPQKMTRAMLADGDPAFLQAFDHRLLRQYSEAPMEAGTWTAAADAMEQGGGALITPAVARRLHVGLGDDLTLPAPDGDLRLKVVGIMTDVTPYGGTVQIDWQDYARHWNDQTASNIAVLLQQGADPAIVRKAILDRWGDAMHLTVRRNREFWAELRAQYEGFYKLMDGLIWISILVSGLAIANTLFASILERRREIGVMRAVGTTRGEVIRVVLGEAFSTGVVGAIFGMPIGVAIHWVMTSSMEFINGSSVHPVMGWGAVGSGLLVALLLAPLVGLLPARWAARLDVVDALRYE
ncbi:MAG TPA: ABC transporter permease [Symbiobacteriaceae bacterium]|jgi:putative ABC transport system permease protein